MVQFSKHVFLAKSSKIALAATVTTSGIKLLVCLRCNIVMTKGFARHLSRVHQETINEMAREELLAICFSSISIYFEQNRELLSAITCCPFMMAMPASAAHIIPKKEGNEDALPK